MDMRGVVQNSSEPVPKRALLRGPVAFAGFTQAPEVHGRSLLNEPLHVVLRRWLGLRC